MEEKKVRLCRVVGGRAALETQCIGRACTYHRADGKCSVDPDPPDRWSGNAWVVEVTREQYLSGDIYATYGPD